MIITMGKQRSHLLVLAPLALAAMLLASECRADWRVVPALTLTERYTDNIRQESNDLKQSQFISEFSPSLTVAKTGPRLTLNGSARWRYFDYSNDALRDTLDNSFQYALSGRATLAEEIFYVDASASAAPQNISAFGPRVEDTPYLAEGQETIKTWRVSPNLNYRIGQTASLALRYTRDRVAGGENRGFANSNGDSMNASLISGPEFRDVSWSLTHSRQDLNDRINGETSNENTAVSLRYAVTARVGLTARAGYDRYQFQSVGNDTAGRNWSVGADWAPTLRTRMSASVGRHFYGQTGSFFLLHRSRRTSWNVSYDDGITTSRDAFLLPATIDTHALLDRLFAATISDPVARQRAVAEYIRNTGLPPSLSDSVNFLSNRYFRQRNLIGSMAFNLARTGVVLFVSSNQRVALSSQQSDSALLGSQLTSRNDNVRQHGAGARINYRLSPRTSALASANWSRSRSVMTEIDDSRRELRVGLTHQLGRNMRAMLDLTRRSGQAGTFGLNSGPYQEHSISASLSAQL
jgi:uncharacterized protein (PEP-CTERM system associated)